MSVAPWTKPSTFRVKVSNAKAIGVDAKDKSGTSDPYLVLDFDKMKKVQSPKIEKTLNPVWEGWVSEFVWETKYPERLSKKFLVVEVWDNDVMDKDDKIGSVSLDLFSCAVGATHYELQLISEDDGHNAVVVIFDLVFEQFSEVYISLGHFRVKEMRFNYDEDDENFKPNPIFTFNTSLDPNTHYKSDVMEETFSPFFKSLPLVKQNYSLREFVQDGLEMRLRHHKAGRDPMIGEFILTFGKFLGEEAPQEGRWYHFEETMTDEDGKPCGKVEGFFGVSGLPKIAQMVDAERKFNGTVGGRKLYEHIPPPLK